MWAQVWNYPLDHGGFTTKITTHPSPRLYKLLKVYQLGVGTHVPF